jgi:HEAT repeat protein
MEKSCPAPQPNKRLQPTAFGERDQSYFGISSWTTSDLDLSVRRLMRRALGHFTPSRSYCMITRMIDPVIGWVSGKPRLRKLTADERAIVIQQLTHRKSRVRWMAADLLGKPRVLESVDPLVQALHDPQWLVRLHAAKALGRIGDPRVCDALSVALSDEHASVRRQVIRALGHLPNERVITHLLYVVQQEPALCSEVARSLTSFVTPRAADALIRATINQRQALESGLAVRLGQLFTPVLLGLLNATSGGWQNRIIVLLGQVGDQRAIPALERRSSDVRSRVQQAAYIALAQVQYRYYERLIPH